MIGEQIKILRERSRKSQEALANDIGVHSNTIARWERGEMIPRGTSIAKIALALGVTPNDLMGETDNPNRPPAGTGVTNPAPAPQRGDIDITIPLTTDAGQPGRIVYEWGGDNRLELPDTPEGRAEMMKFIERIMAAGYRLNSAAIEEDGQHREYIKAPETPPAPAGEPKSA